MNRYIYRVYNRLCQSSYDIGNSLHRMTKTARVTTDYLLYLVTAYHPRLSYQQRYEPEYASWQSKYGTYIALSIWTATLLGMMNLYFKRNKLNSSKRQQIHVHRLKHAESK